IRLARGGELDQARAMLAHAATQAEAEAQTRGDSALAAQAQGMRRVEASLPSVASEPSDAASAPMDFDDDGAAAERAPAAIRSEHERATRVLHGPM
ncbi:MAG: hypothetical protein M3Y87_31490, partial [Myxococcota bacterium]|nr:hypothetical protein [Myxococcota bacterium]